MSAYAELVEGCERAFLLSLMPLSNGELLGNKSRCEALSAVLAEVLRTLETWSRAKETVYDETTFRDMIRASPLSERAES